MASSVFAPEIPKPYLLLAKAAGGIAQVDSAQAVIEQRYPYCWGLLQEHQRSLVSSIATIGDPAGYCNEVGSEDAPADQGSSVEHFVSEIGKIIADPKGYEHRHMEWERESALLNGEEL